MYANGAVVEQGGESAHGAGLLMGPPGNCPSCPVSKMVLSQIQ